MRADIREPQVACAAVEGVAPRIPQAERGDLPRGFGDGWIDAQELPEHDAHVLRTVRLVRVTDGVRIRPTVSHAHVQAAALVEREHAAFVIHERLLDEEQFALARRDADAVLRQEPRDVCVPVPVAVVDIEGVIGRVAGAERQTEEPALAVVEHCAAEVEERSGRSAGTCHLDDPPLLDDVEQRCIVRSRHDVVRLDEARPDLVEVIRRVGRSPAGRGEDGERHESEGAE